MAKVIVIGGGVGGLTVAHELAERGLEVHVYEALAAWGGKARSQPVYGTGTMGRRDLPGDHFVLAVPIEAAQRLMSADLAALDVQCERLRQANIDHLVSWMVGIQIYLYEDVPLVRGHMVFPDSPWALTAISQPQFWKETLGLFRRHYGNGDVGGLISVDISEWDKEGTFVRKKARDCTKDEILAEVWWQLKAALNGSRVDQQTLTDELLHSWHRAHWFIYEYPISFTGSEVPLSLIVSLMVLDVRWCRFLLETHEINTGGNIHAEEPFRSPRDHCIHRHCIRSLGHSLAAKTIAANG